jgi:hypothetical protein
MELEEFPVYVERREDYFVVLEGEDKVEVGMGVQTFDDLYSTLAHYDFADPLNSVMKLVITEDAGTHLSDLEMDILTRVTALQNAVRERNWRLDELEILVQKVFEY